MTLNQQSDLKMGQLFFLIVMLILKMEDAVAEKDLDLASFYTDTKMNGNELKETCDKAVLESRARVSLG